MPDDAPLVLCDRFRIDARLKRGSYAEVFRARDLHTELDVAVKILHPHVPDDSPHAARFRYEPEILASLVHPNVVRLIHPADRMGDVRFFVMELAENGSLSDVLQREGPLSLPVLLGFTRDVLRALVLVHGADVIHRDIKPANILVMSDGRARLADFGIAQDDDHRMTVAGDRLGTPSLMAPEQARDPRAVDASTDLYALGASLFVILTDRPAVELIADAYRPDALAALPPFLRPVIDRATRVLPDERYQRTQEMLDDVDRVLMRWTEPAWSPGPPPT